jgi:hypothetical protein
MEASRPTVPFTVNPLDTTSSLPSGSPPVSSEEPNTNSDRKSEEAPSTSLTAVAPTSNPVYRPIVVSDSDRKFWNDQTLQNTVRLIEQTRDYWLSAMKPAPAAGYPATDNTYSICLVAPENESVREKIFIIAQTALACGAWKAAKPAYMLRKYPEQHESCVLLSPMTDTEVCPPRSIASGNAVRKKFNAKELPLYEKYSGFPGMPDTWAVVPVSSWSPETPSNQKGALQTRYDADCWTLLKDSGKWSDSDRRKQTLVVGNCVSQALARIHEDLLAHGDVGAPNIFCNVNAQGLIIKAVLSDFGSMMGYGDRRNFGKPTCAFFFAAPETALRKSTSSIQLMQAGDIWSLGCTLAMLYVKGQVPHWVLDMNKVHKEIQERNKKKKSEIASDDDVGSDQDEISEGQRRDNEYFETIFPVTILNEVQSDERKKFNKWCDKNFPKNDPIACLIRRMLSVEWERRIAAKQVLLEIEKINFEEGDEKKTSESKHADGLGSLRPDEGSLEHKGDGVDSLTQATNNLNIASSSSLGV